MSGDRTLKTGADEAPAENPLGGGSLSQSKEFNTTDELRTRLEGIRLRRKLLQEELENLQEEEGRVMAMLRRTSVSKRSACEETEDPEANLSKEDLALFQTIKEIFAKATADQAACREAQKQLDAILSEGNAPLRPHAPVSTTGDAEESHENSPANATTAEISQYAANAGAKTPELRQRQRELFIKHLARNAVTLLTDPFGNYFIQRGFARATPEELKLILETVGPSIPEVSCNMHGTRGIQKLIDCCSNDEHYELFCESIANEVVPMVCDLNANHVVHRLLMSSTFSQPEKENLYHILMINCVEIGMNKQGCCMIQRCLENAPLNFRIEMINALIQHTLQLVQDPFGNYVIQFLLDLPQDAATMNSATSLANRVIRQVLHHVATLSCNKFSSNVIEKCLRASTPEVRQLLLDELTDPSTLPKLLTQSYANYVVQTALLISDDNQFAQLRDAIQPLSHLLKNSPYGVKIESKIQKRARENARKRAPRSRQRGHGGQEYELGPVRPGQAGVPANSYAGPNYNPFAQQQSAAPGYVGGPPKAVDDQQQQLAMLQLYAQQQYFQQLGGGGPRGHNPYATHGPPIAAGEGPYAAPAPPQADQSMSYAHSPYAVGAPGYPGPGQPGARQPYLR